MTEKLINEIINAIENELHSQIGRLDQESTHDFFEMLTYHLGWTGEGSGNNTRGKHIRPLLLLLCAASGDLSYSWQKALPGAAAVELIHNFSLIHDDIQDNSDKRRNRPTVWRKWGIPQAINAGDGLYALSTLAASDLLQFNSADLVVQVTSILNNACLDLTRGQFMDMSFEKRGLLTLDEYWLMIKYKTGALISASAEIGAVLGGMENQAQEVHREFGHYLGLAFQIRDDILGIWGTESQIGKSAINDLISGKKTLPVLCGLQKEGPFAMRWSQGNILPDEVPSLREQLTREGVKIFAENTADQMTELALKFLNILSPKGPYGEALYDLTRILLNREA
jgi:geranylgeranyl diphosphate synthase type I